MAEQGYVLAVVGATGAVGREMLLMLEELDLPLKNVKLLASARSAGLEVPFGGKELVVEELTQDSFAGVDVAMFSAGGARSKEYAAAAVKAGAIVVDNSSAFRLDEGVPLVVPEVNAESLDDHKGVIANPNCSTIQMMPPLKALEEAAGLERVIVSTYQSASGAGQAGIDELWAQTRNYIEKRPVENKVFAKPLPFDVLPQIGDFQPSGYTDEEEKMFFESRKILSLPELAVSATCARVPVLRGHLESVTVDLKDALSAEDARKAFESFPGVVVVDDPANMEYPTAHACAGHREIYVGRIRVDNVLPKTLHFWIACDNLWKGAAWNAVQIVESLHERGLLRG